MMKKMALTKDEREGMIGTLEVLGTKSPDYYNKCTDEQLEQEYKKLTPVTEGGK